MSDSPSLVTSLAPKVLSDQSDLKKIKPYLELLKSILDAEGVNNIALTGIYGSGKSTIIKTFQHLYPEYKYLNISLASFKDGKEILPDNENTQNNDFERLLEISILQQIFYQVKPSKIPDSRFKRIVNLTQWKLWLFATGLILWIAAILILFRYDYISKLNPDFWNSENPFDIFSVCLFCIFFLGIGMFAKHVARLFNNSRISKFTIRGELELGDGQDKSVFNEHLEEIIYFFERTNYNVIIIEDLDRFNNTDIFTKLREINILLNSSKVISRKIKFIYAIRDEMFYDKNERVKFFEYIIPVIPFINPSNADEQLTKLISKAKLTNVLSHNFTQDVVTFIDDIDMRLLINIFHEYQIYRQNLAADLDQDELFAIITYKNLYPDDFGELHKRKGQLYKIISKKSEYTHSLIKKNEKRINELESDIHHANNEYFRIESELRSIYINGLRTMLPDAISIYIDNNFREFKDILENSELFESLRSLESVQYEYYYQHNPSYYRITKTKNTEVSFSKIEKYINPDFTYMERLDMIKNKGMDRQFALKGEIEQLRTQINDIENWSIKKIFEEVDIQEHLGLFNEDLLMRNLLINGYINENYNDYISLFHEVSITKEDYKFIRDVKSGILTPFEYQLNEIGNLIQKLPQKYFHRDVILNFSLLRFIEENAAQYQDEYLAVIKNLSSGKERSVKFIDAYIAQHRHDIGLFIRSISKNWIGFWDDVRHKRNYPDDKITEYALLIFLHTELKDIQKFNKDGDISTYIEERPDLIELFSFPEGIIKFKDILQEFEIRFSSLLNPTQATTYLFDYIYDHSHYKINFNNISLLIKSKDVGVKDEDLKVANYTVVSNSNCATLKSYIESYISTYVEHVILKNIDNTRESVLSFINLLNNSKLKLPLKVKLIETQQAVVQNISDVEQVELYKKLFDDSKVTPSWDNVFVYYEVLELNDFDETLVEFLNNESNYIELSKLKLKAGGERSEKFIKSFISRILKCNELTYDAYSFLMKSSNYKWDSLYFEELTSDKVQLLIDDSIIKLSKANFERLEEYFNEENLHIAILEKHYKNFIQEFDEYKIKETDFLKLLKSNKLDDKAKINLIEKVDVPVIISNGEIARIICRLYALYDKKGLEYSVLEGIMEHSYSKEYGIRMLNNNLDNLSDLQITSLVGGLGFLYKEIFKKRYKPKFDNTDYHKRLFDELRGRKLIIDYEPYSKDNSKLRVKANYI